MGSMFNLRVGNQILVINTNMIQVFQIRIDIIAEEITRRNLADVGVFYLHLLVLYLVK